MPTKIRGSVPLVQHDSPGANVDVCRSAIARRARLAALSAHAATRIKKPARTRRKSPPVVPTYGYGGVAWHQKRARSLEERSSCLAFKKIDAEKLNSVSKLNSLFD